MYAGKAVAMEVGGAYSLEDCYMRIIGYAGNTGFDPDSPYNKVLWTGRVKDGDW